jgi:hypothetical protein
MKELVLACLLVASHQSGTCQNIQVSVKLLKGRKAVSPYIYGRNNALSRKPGRPVSAANWQLYKDAGLNFFRENDGNDLTKYNWRLKLSSYPDWYNNVDTCDWDYDEQTLQQNIPTAQGMWGFQLIGQAAVTTAHNFNEWNFNQAQWWPGVEQNLAGGGIVNPAGGPKALKNGDTSLYLQPWTADSTVGIIGHWFGNGGLGLDANRTLYWNMDNEPEIWGNTHDDVWPVQPDPETFLQSYFAVAKKARALFPSIRLTGPVGASEWSWYTWNNKLITGADGKQYSWLEYFVKRVAEEQQRTGIRLLDVIDLHFYPSSSSASDVVQYHRVFFDSTYLFPEANGVRVVNGGWDNSIKTEDIFGRCQKWLNQYMGSGNGVGFGVSEAATQLQNDPNALAVWYAGTMGEFMKNGVEYFAPQIWDIGMYETLHLFSRYNKNISVEATSSDEQNVSAYATTNNVSDSATVVLVNRSLTQSETVTLSFPDLPIAGHSVTSLTLSGLPPGRETFVSHTNNALAAASLTPQSDNTLKVVVAPLSVTSLLVAGSLQTLPINLLSFSAVKSNSSVNLDFAVTSDVNLASFGVERSADGQNFAAVGSVPASAGLARSDSAKEYSFTDGQPLSGMNYYRLKMADQDESYKYSPVVSIHNDDVNSPAVMLYPNPANDVVNLQLNLPAGQIVVLITDASGRTVRTSLLQSSGNKFSTSLAISDLAKGVYYLSAGGETKPFVKE